MARQEVSPEDKIHVVAGAARAWHIGVISASILILELAFIRLIPGEVRAISYFTNLILISVFFGMGLGCILQNRGSLQVFLPLGLLALFGFVWFGRGIVIYPQAMDVHYWLNYVELDRQAPGMPLFIAAAAAFVLNALPFLALGQALARTMNAYPRLVAYGWDIAGSLLGTLVFVLASLWRIPPWTWPPVIACAWVILFCRSAVQRVVTLGAGLLFVLLSDAPYHSTWSPYYLVQHRQEQGGTRVWVNASFHQFCIDFTSAEPNQRSLHELMKQKWGLPYQIFRNRHQGRAPESVLVLGAGTGNDINIALMQGVKDVVAVEIDPEIVKIGREHNSLKPYSDERVTVVVDDARHFLRNCDRNFDMVVFGTLDSQVLLANQANLRLESYVYTVESLQDVKRVLKADGLMTVHYSVFKPWLMGRLLATIQTVFGENCRMVRESHRFLFDTTFLASKDPEMLRDLRPNPEVNDQIPCTDDWPFIYLRSRLISPVYVWLFAFAACLVAVAFFMLRREYQQREWHTDFFFLGVGFTLLESNAIVRLSLVFGNTWVVNAVVFSAVLLTIFLANLLVIRKYAPPLFGAWIGLVAFVLINYFVDVSWLFYVSVFWRVGACALLIGLPVFFAATCFSRLFESQVTTGYALGINLIGAMLGGMVEYVSMAIGTRAVWLVVLGVYVAAWLSCVRLRRQA